MRILHEVTPKEKRDEIVSVYLSGDNSYEELGKYYKVDPNKIRVWVSRYRKSKCHKGRSQVRRCRRLFPPTSVHVSRGRF